MTHMWQDAGMTGEHTMIDEPGKPEGKQAVMDALTRATIDLIVDEGLNVSVRQIATKAGVNHGLVHTYFGSKQGLLTAAFEEIQRLASADADDSGFPPPALASRRSGQLARAIARIRLDADGDLFESHPVSDSWRRALAESRPELTEDEIETMVITASALGLGWALFAEHLADTLDLDLDRRAALDKHIEALVAELGGIPTQR